MKNFSRENNMAIALLRSVVLVSIIGLFFQSGKMAFGNDKMKEPSNLTVTAYATFGQGGPHRETAETVGGGTIFYTLQLHGLKQNSKGEYAYEVDMEILGSDSLVLYKYPLLSEVVHNHLPSSDVFINNSCTFPIDQQVGKYKVHIQARDKLTNEEASTLLEITVVPPDTFGATNIGYFQDKDEKCPTGGNVTLGDEVFLCFSIVGFQLKDNTTKIHCRAYGTDENGKRLGPYDLVQTIIQEHVDDNCYKTGIKVKKNINCYRVGSYRVVLELKDLLSNQKAIYELPIVIHDSSVNEVAIPLTLKNQDPEPSIVTLSVSPKGDDEKTLRGDSTNEEMGRRVDSEKSDDVTTPSIQILFDPPTVGSAGTTDILAGDTLVYTLHLNNCSRNEKGEADCDIFYFIQDLNGKIITPRGHCHLEFTFWLGHGEYVYRDYLGFPADILPGRYKFVAQVYDRVSKKLKESYREFSIPRHEDFDIFFSKIKPNLDTPISNYGNCTAGNGFSMNFGLTNFGKNENHSNIKVKFSIFDENGNVLSPNYETSDPNKLKAESNYLLCDLNELAGCPGKFIYRFEAIDSSTGKKSIRIVPVVVWPQLGNAKEKRNASL